LDGSSTWGGGVNIIFNTYPFAFATPGGGEVQLSQYFRTLGAVGVDVAKFDLWRGFEQINDESVVHFFSCMPGSVHFVNECLRRGIPVVVSPNLWVTEETAHQYPADEIRAVLGAASAVVCNSDAESDLLARVFGLPRGKFFTVYNAVDPRFLQPVSPSQFRQASGIHGRFVLNVANIEVRKNQLALVRAMKKFPDMTLVVVGHVRDRDYADQCAALGGAQWRHVGSFPHASELLRSAYAACEVFALPSTLETPGLAALEAAACGCRLVITKEGSAAEYFGGGAVYADPSDVDNIALAIRQALESPRGVLHPTMEDCYVWPVVIQRLLPVYEVLLARKKAMATFFTSHGWVGEGFNEVECDGEGAFVWSRNSSNLQVPSGLMAWRWWSVADIEVDLFLDGVLVRQGLRVGPRWETFCLNVADDVGAKLRRLEIRVRGGAQIVGGRDLGVMLRDLAHLGCGELAEGARERWCLSHGLFFEAAGVRASDFHEVERDAEGPFVWSRAASSMSVPDGFVAWRWWSLAWTQVDILLNGVVAQKGVPVGPEWRLHWLDLSSVRPGAAHAVELRLSGGATTLGGRDLGVMMRDLVHFDAARRGDGRRERWCRQHGLVLEAAGARGEGFYPTERDGRGFFVWSRSQFNLHVPSGLVQIEGFVAQKSRVVLKVAGSDDPLLSVELDVGDSRLEFEVPGTSESPEPSEVVLEGSIEKLGATGHADPRDLGLAMRSVVFKN